ncbi:hypothetical protein DYB25_001734 [Aphanomyces astaci]|uniref:Uncharacterized protein n=1 Tax=Aphanomyces astaci TaxID=112090 RepID=A0A397B7F9_APHAT|nr:hypothetical protein DYB25_001734 [Aphanomyces astaci]RHY18937.1 hypothetical protein DYB36_010410 [Aphanomyces astaci]RHY89817.1 hypothetical protein DYB35_000238 [Aphanomyces astaci]
MSNVQEVEAKVTALEGRLGAVESSIGGAVGGSSSDDLVALQKQLLVSLRGVRSALRDEDKARAASQSTSGSHEALLEENAALKKQVAKLNYRIEHLLRHVPQPE